METQMEGDVSQAEATDVAGLYNRVASRYSSTGPAVFAHFGQRLVDLAALAPWERVLDVGAGRGAILFPAAARVGARGQVIGIDVAAAITRIAALVRPALLRFDRVLPCAPRRRTRGREQWRGPG